MERYELIVVGAGPSGLSAAIEAAGRGLKVAVFDENEKPGGQLFKQIHKFFGSKEHQAKIRGFRIGEKLLQDAKEAGVQVVLNATVVGLYADRELVVRIGEGVKHFKADAVVIATGALENAVPFEGWTLPGVIGAGAAQTMINIHGIQPGKRILMLGTGNVGLVVSYQLAQCGCEIVAMVDAAPGIGGYGVHAAKVARTGVPFYLSHTIIRAEGTNRVAGAVIAELDAGWKPVPGTEKHFDVDTICLAVGLSPMSQLLKMAGCEMKDDPAKGGQVPVCGDNGATSIPGIFVAGDVSGIEEASSAMIEGRISGICVAEYLGYVEAAEKQKQVDTLENALGALRQGMFAPGNKGKAFELTDEGYQISKSLLKKGYLEDEEVLGFPGVKRMKGIHPVIECTQNIPCNPCQDACPKHCIRVGENITALPAIEPGAKCSGCGMCVAHCPGQAIFLVNEEYEDGFAAVTMPYEFYPLPQAGDMGVALSRSGATICAAEVLSVKSAPAFDRTILLTVKVPRKFAMKARFYKPGKDAGYGND